MKRFRKQIASKAIFRVFCQVIAPGLSQNSMKGLRITKNVKEIKFQEVS